MIACALDSTELLRNSILGSMSQNPYTKGLVEGQTYPADENTLRALNEIGLTYGGSTLYVISPGGTEVTISIVVSPEAAASFTQQGRTSWQKANAGPAAEMDLDAVQNAFHKQIGTNYDKLQKFVESVLLSTKELAKRSRGNTEVYESLSEIWTQIQTDPNHRTKMALMSQFLSEAHAFMTFKVEDMRALAESFNAEEADADYVMMADINDTIRLYERTLNDFKEFMDGAQSNPLKTLVNEAWNAKEEMKGIFTKASDKLALTDLTSTLSTKFEKLKAEKEAEIAKLEASKAGASKSRSLRIDQAIAQIKKDLDKYAPSKENLEVHLHGDAADSSQVHKFILAGMMNPDLLIQGFMRVIKDKLQQAHVRFYEIGNEIGREFNKLVETGFSTSNIDQSFQELYEEVTEYEYDSETGEIVENNTLYFVGETSNQWRTEFTKLKAELSKLGNEIKKERALDGTTDFDRVAFAAKENAYDQKLTEYVQWRRDNFESEYDDRYQAVDSILDSVATFGGKQMTLREIRSTFYDAISNIQNEVEALTGVPSEDQILQISELRRAFEAVKSTEGKTTGSEELRIAELFTEYQTGMKEMTERWDISSSALDRFHSRKAKIDRQYEAGQIDKEARDRWYAANTTIVYSADYWARRKLVVDQLNQIAEELFRITGTRSEVNLKESYERLEAISRKYRDHNSHIDGTMLTGEEVATTKEIEEQIELLKQQTKAAYSGFLGEEFADYYQQIEEQRNVLLDEIKELKRNDPSMSKTTQARIKSIRADLKQLKGNEAAFVAKYLEGQGMSKENIASFQGLYDMYRTAISELSQLTESVETEAYYEEYQNQLNAFVASKTQAERDAKIRSTQLVRVGKKKYKKDSQGQFHEVAYDGSLLDEITSPVEIMDHLFRKEFEKSAWYKANHFEAERYDNASGEMVTRNIPIYSWRISKPKNPRYIKEAAPNISWKKRVIKDEYRNPNKRTEADGLPNIKQGRHPNLQYNNLRAANPELWKFRDSMIDKYMTAQEHYPEGQRMGMRVPSIEKEMSTYEIIQNREFGRVKKNIARKFNSNQQDVDEGLYRVSDEAGYERRFIPVLFRGKLEAPLVSRNIVETIGKYAGQAEIYAARVDLARKGEALETTLSHQNHAPSSESMNKYAKFLNIIRRNKARGQNQRLDTVRTMINMFVYGETVGEESELGKRVHKIISNLLGARAALIFSEFPSVIKSITGGTMVVGGTGWSQLVNLFGGEAQQLIKASMKTGAAKFSLSDYGWAKGQYVKNSGQFVQDTGKVSNKSYWTQFAEFFDANEMAYIDNFGEQLYSKGILRNMTVNNMALFKNVVEHELFMTAIMAYAKNRQVLTDRGESIPLYKAFKVEAGTLTMLPGVNISENEMADIRGNIAALLRDINGNYGKLDRTLIENYWVGKTIVFMKKWLVPMVVARYGGKKYSVEQDRIVQGYLRETAGLFLEGFAHAYRGIKSFEYLDFSGVGRILVPALDPDLTQAQRDAIRRTRTELIILSLMYVTYRAVLGYDPEDPERFKDLKKKNYYIQGLTYAMVKATSEQSTFIPPFGFDEINKTRTNLLANTSPFLTEAWDIIRKDIAWDLDPSTKFFKEYKRDAGNNKKGDIKAVAHLWKMAGLTNSKQDPAEALRALESNLNK